MEKWNHNKILYLIKEYEIRPVLWNPVLPEYRIKQNRDDAWLELSHIFHLSRAELEKKMRSLMYQYRREKDKIRRYRLLNDGSVEDRVVESKWFAYKSFAFLDGRMKLRRGRLNTSMCHSDEEYESAGDRVCMDHDEPEIVHIEELNETYQPDDEIATTITTSVTKNCKNEFTITPVTSSKRRRVMTEENQPMEPSSIIKTVYESCPKKDDCDLFGDYIASKMRNINDLRRRAILEHKIITLIFEDEVFQYSNDPMVDNE